MLGLGAGSTRCPPPKEEGEICFSPLTTSPVELGAQAGAAKPLSPCTQGPLAWGTISSLSPNPAGVQCQGRSEIRSPMEQALSPLKARIAGPGRGGDPWRFLSQGTQVQGQLAVWAAGYGREFRSPLEQVSPGRGKVLSRPLSPGTQVHGRLAARAAGGDGREFRSPLEQVSPGRGSVETAVSRDPSPWQAGSTGCLRGGQRILKPSGASESRARKGSVETAVSRDPSPWPAGSSGCQHVLLGRTSSRIPKPIGASEPKARRETRGKEPKPRGARASMPGHGRDGITAREREMFIGTQFSNLYTLVDTSARGSVGEDQIPSSSATDVSHERAREQAGSHRETQEWHHPRGLPPRSVHSEHGLAPDASP
jgi:hypothetical protein